MEIPVLYEDAQLIVCIKPAGVLSEEGGMPELLQTRCGCSRVYCVHRLDKPVSGVMVYAKDGKTAAKLSELLSSHRVTKEYLAVVQGRPEAEQGILRDLLFHDAGKNKTYVVQRSRKGVKEAELEYAALESICSEEFGSLSLLRITLHTGRSHQIRVQFASRKLPLAGDRRYGSSISDCGIALQSHRLAFPHPVTGEPLCFSAPFPQEWPWNRFSAPIA